MKWNTVQLGDVCEVVTKGTTPRTLGKEYASSGIPFLRAENLQGDEVVLDKSTLFIDEETDQILARSRIYPGDVLISIAGTIGRAAIVPDSLPQMNCNQAVAIIRIASCLNNRFFLYWLKSNDAQMQMIGAKVTLTISNLSLGQIKQLKVPLPTISEQRRIVEILDQADALRKKRAEADEKSDRILPALFIKMFGDPVDNPKGLPEVELGKVISEGPQNGLYKHASFYGEGTPILRIDSFYDGIIDTSKPLKRLKLTDDELALYKLNRNDIVINRVNSPEFLGKSAIVPEFTEITVFESNMMRFSVDESKAYPSYIIHHLQLPSIKQQILTKAKRAINQASINQKDVKALTLLLPSPNLQKQFILQTDGIQKLIINQEKCRQKVEGLFQILLHRAFSGDLTAEWRKAHMNEILQEMEHQAKVLGIPHTVEYEQLALSDLP